MAPKADFPDRPTKPTSGHRKLRLDFARGVLLRAAMDIDTHRLVVELCARVGMMFEDASPHALDVAALNAGALPGRVAELIQATGSAAALLAAADVLMHTPCAADE